MNLKNKIKGAKEYFSSVKIRLFLTLALTTLAIIAFLICMNSFALEKFYLYSKQNTLEEVYNQLNDYYNGNDHELDLEKEMERIAIRNNFDILIKDEDNINIYSTSADFYYVIDSIIGAGTSKRSKELETNDKFTIDLQKDFKNG